MSESRAWVSSSNLTLSEWCDLGQGIYSLEALVSLIVTCGVWTSSSLTVFSSLKNPLIHTIGNSGSCVYSFFYSLKHYYY